MNSTDTRVDWGMRGRTKWDIFLPSLVEGCLFPAVYQRLLAALIKTYKYAEAYVFLLAILF